MRILLDTHAFLWFLLDDPQLSATAQTVIEDPLNEIEVSPASYWEIAIKIRLGKYALPEPYQAFMEREITDQPPTGYRADHLLAGSELGDSARGSKRHASQPN